MIKMTMDNLFSRLSRAAAGAALLCTLVVLGCPDETPASDVRGNYDLSYDNVLTLRLKVGGKTFEAEGSEDQEVSFETDSGPVSLDLNEFCGREEVECPSETLWTKVSVDQPNIEARNPNTHVLNFINNTVHDLPAGERAAVVSGLIDEQDRFGLVLGGGRKSEGDCTLLALSTAGGRFSHEGERVEEIPEPDAGNDGGVGDGGAVADGGIDGAPRTRVVWDEGAPVDGIQQGKVKLGFLGACAFGPALVAATLEIETGFVGTRTGAFDPPPYVELDPADVDAGLIADFDGGTIADAGPTADAGAGPDAGTGLDAGLGDGG